MSQSIVQGQSEGAARKTRIRSGRIDRHNSPLLVELAVEAHGEQRRAADGALFLEHVIEVATLLDGAGFDDELIAAGLLARFGRARDP